MKLFLSIIFSFFVSSLSFAGNSTLDFSHPKLEKNRNISLELPAGWSLQGDDGKFDDSDETASKTLILEKEDAKIWLTIANLDFDLSMDGLTKILNRKVRNIGLDRISVEGKANVKTVNNDSLQGVYAGFTNKKHATNCITLGRYASDGLYVYSTLQTASLEGTLYEESLGLIHSLRITAK